MVLGVREGESLGFGGLNISTGGKMGNGSVRLETVGGLTVPLTGGIEGELLGWKQWEC